MKHLLIHFTGETNIRLTGGSHNMEGRVEIIKRGQWVAICDEDWDDVEATIVCKTLAAFPFDRYESCAVRFTHFNYSPIKF